MTLDFPVLIDEERACPEASFVLILVPAPSVSAQTMTTQDHAGGQSEVNETATALSAPTLIDEGRRRGQRSGLGESARRGRRMICEWISGLSAER